MAVRRGETRTMRSRTRKATARVGLGIGAVMVGVGVYVAVRALMFGAPPLTGMVWLDLGFAFFFLVRGALQYRRWRQLGIAPGT